MALTTPEAVGSMLAIDVDELGAVDTASLAQACDDAEALVLSFLRRSTLDDLTAPNARAAEFIATKIAARIYRNPQEAATYSYNDVSQTYSDPRVITSDERAVLSPLRKRFRGPVFIGAEPPEPVV